MRRSRADEDDARLAIPVRGVSLQILPSNGGLPVNPFWAMRSLRRAPCVTIAEALLAVSRGVVTIW
jgi:hypothetical protein